MEQTQYWMWPKQKQNPYIDLMSSHIFPSSSRTSHYHLLPSTRGCDSWEEQAFAEDAAGGALGGCIWPPRSYSCTFCKREFRSAQALGGHMNVHRRDRARLKQSQGPEIEPFPHNNQEATILEAQSHHQTCNFLFNPILEFDNKVVATPSCPIRVSSNSRLDYHNNETQYLFPYVQEQSTIFHPKSSSYHSESQARFSRDSVGELEFFMPSRAKGENFAKADLSIEQDSTTTARPNKRDFVKADLSISLNLVICTTNNLLSSASDDDDDPEDGRCKKRPIDPSSALNLFDNEQDSDDDTTTDEQLMMMRTMNHTVSCIDDVDLELRLGVSPKVK